jgi:hypothetical protein
MNYGLIATKSWLLVESCEHGLEIARHDDLWITAQLRGWKWPVQGDDDAVRRCRVEARRGRRAAMACLAMVKHHRRHWRQLAC